MAAAGDAPFSGYGGHVCGRRRIPAERSSDYTATIAWGAGSSATGTIRQRGDGGSGNFHVTGSFTYAEEGSYTVR